MDGTIKILDKGDNMKKEIIREDLVVIEKNLEKVDSIVSCRIIMGEERDIDEIHIVSNGRRNPKQISRDIQSILIATYDIHINYKKISIAEIPDHSLGKLEGRLKIKKVSHENNGGRAMVKVALDKSGESFESFKMGVNVIRNIERMLASSTLENIEKALGCEELFILEDIRTINVSSDKVMVVVLMAIYNGREHRMCGSCLVGNDYKEAVVKATLDAANRFISK